MESGACERGKASSEKKNLTLVRRLTIRCQMKKHFMLVMAAATLIAGFCVAEKYGALAGILSTSAAVVSMRFGIPQLGAKANPIIENPDLVQGNQDLADEVLYKESISSTFGNLVADTLDAATFAVKCVINLAAAVMNVFTGETDLALNAPSTVGTITRDDNTKKTSPWTLADGADDSALGVAIRAAVNSALAAVKPSRSISSLQNAIEDAVNGISADLLAGQVVNVVVDQSGDGSVIIVLGDGPRALAPAYDAGVAYVAGAIASQGGHNFLANASMAAGSHAPGADGDDTWTDQGAALEAVASFKQVTSGSGLGSSATLPFE